MKHGADYGLVQLLTDISLPVATESPISWLSELKDVITNRTVVYGSNGNVHTNPVMQMAAILLDEDAKLLDFSDSPFIEGVKSNYFKGLSFIMLYRGDVDNAKRYFEMVHRSNQNTELLRLALDRFDEAQRILSESRDDLNQLREKHGFESLDLFLLDNSDQNE
ncbi:MAG: hypothetical protein IH934_04995 [Nanoarchaeota archaeon]|nr:hypothetical protein [Nanoarchaeota archaeon]